MSIRVIEPPAVEPLTIQEAKAHLRVDSDVEDSYISSLIVAARQTAEIWLRRALITQTICFTITIEKNPSGRLSGPVECRSKVIELPRPPLQEVVSVEVEQGPGNWLSLPSTDYVVDVMEEPGILFPSSGYWNGSKFRITYKAGYGDNGNDVPFPIRQAMLLLIGDWYENRQNIVTGVNLRELPRASMELMAPYRIWEV